MDGEEILTVDPGPLGFWNLGEFSTSGLQSPWKGASKMAPFDQKVITCREVILATTFSTLLNFREIEWGSGLSVMQLRMNFSLGSPCISHAAANLG